jgi:hypothetical protein
MKNIALTIRSHVLEVQYGHNDSFEGLNWACGAYSDVDVRPPPLGGKVTDLHFVLYRYHTA